jgi:type IV pilus assembly protein PilW
MRRQHKRAGFTLVEFLIAMTLGSLIVSTATFVFMSNRATFVVESALARLQENGRYASYIIAHDLRMAGFQGCANQKFIQINNLAKSSPPALIYTYPLQGYDGNGEQFTPALPSNLTGKALASSDVIEARMASSAGAHLSTNMGSTSAVIPMINQTAILPNSPVMITNCLIGDIFIASSGTNASQITHTTATNTSNNLSLAYPNYAMVMPFVYYAYYIKDSGRVNALNRPIPVLVRQNYLGVEEEIAESVESMSVTYGVDTNEDKTADTYESANQVNSANQWNKVLSIQIRLLFSTTEDVSKTPQSYQFNGKTITPTDKRLRRAWDVFVALRNR